MDVHDDADWVRAFVLRMMALQLLVAAGRIPSVQRLFQAGDVVPLGVPLGSPDSQLTYALISASPDIAHALQLPSGVFEIFVIFGITEAEAKILRTPDRQRFQEILLTETAFPVTAVNRSSIV